MPKAESQKETSLRLATLDFKHKKYKLCQY